MYLIGIAGSVAAGKSTYAHFLQEKLKEKPHYFATQVVNTDGFLFPNAVLMEKGMMHRKGFPDSYDVEKLVDFLRALKAEKPISAPLYDHVHYDVQKGKLLIIEENTDICIVEGVNVLQKEYRDFFDYKIYIDADEKLLLQWFLERFMRLRAEARSHPEVYFHRYSNLSDEEAKSFALKIWKDVNHVNLHDYILPCHQYADYIICKGDGHSVLM